MTGEGHKPEHADAPPTTGDNEQNRLDPLQFVAPTEFVELPSKGVAYPANHPLYNEETIEIRFMTAKDEDILSSKTLLKKGIAIERFMQNIVVNQKINVKKLLVADRNAILIAARVSGYGDEYETKVTCPSCGTSTDDVFDLNNTQITNINTHEDLNITVTDNGTFKVIMPLTKHEIEYRLLTGEDENAIARSSAHRRKQKLNETMLTDQYKRMIVSVAGHTSTETIRKYVDTMPTRDSRYLRSCYKATAPEIKISREFNCHSCGYEQEMEVPFGADFFWPNR